MKYGLLYVTPINKNGDRQFINIGDTIQTIAIKDIYNQMGINSKDILPIELSKINEYRGEYVLLPININLSLNWIINIFPLPPNIIPVFLGLSFFSASSLSPELVEYFKLYSPIGCRDEKTLMLMREYGISAYLGGCITMTLTRDYFNDKSKIFLVDVDKSIQYKIPENVKADSEIVFLSHILESENNNDIDFLFSKTNEIINDYCQHAKLIITSRLHCISPCISLGLPVVPLVENISPRMGWIDKLIDFKTQDDLDSIEWEPNIIEVSSIKELIKITAIQRIKETYQKYNNICNLSYFFENRKKAQYGSFYYNKLKNLKALESKMGYMVWGAGQIGMNVCEVIKDLYPDFKFICAIDSYAEGQFNGKEILKPSELKYDKDIIIFITTYSGLQVATSVIEYLGFIKDKDYFCLATKNG